MSALLIVIALIVLFLVARHALIVRKEKRELAQVARLMRDYDFSQRQREQDSVWGMRR